MMKRFISSLALLLATVLLISACGAGKQPEVTTPEESTPDVTTPEETTPEETTPEETTPEETTPEETTPGGPESVPLQPTCEHIFTSRIVLEQVTTTTDGKIANVCGTCGGWQEEILPAVKSIKLLAIGNSFSDNALKYLPILAKELGIEEIIVGKLYVGGCVIDGHWSRAQSGANYERFDLNLGDGWKSQSTKTLKYALQYCDWDIITMQQGSHVSGVPSSLGNLQNLVDFVNANKTNPNAKLYWHMTWAYSQFTAHSGFANYNNDQLTMYNAIVDTVKTCILTNDSFAGVIPAGTAVQNYRGKDTNNKVAEGEYITMGDGYHLKNYSEVLTAMTWLKTLTGLSLDKIKCNSHEDVKFVGANLRGMKRAVEYAYQNPYEVRSAY
jgi:hypothetical protein